MPENPVVTMTPAECARCHKETDDCEGVNVGQQQVVLCKRCADTFWRRFQRFMVGG